jgi:predicted O-methyltransferase YrrM
VSRLARRSRGPNPTLRSGQLDNQGLESLVASIVDRENWDGGRERIVVEVGTGGGRGSTVAIHRALAAQDCSFQLIGYEGDVELAALAARHWQEADDVRVVNEYFMHREDIELAVKQRVAPGDREFYLPEFDSVAKRENFLSTTPHGPIDLLFIDSVRYTHLAILCAATPWLQPRTIVLMEDDIPGYGELAIVEREFELLDVARHEIAGHQWPLVEFRIERGPN